MVEIKRFELLTPCVQGRCSPSWAIPPYGLSCLTTLFILLEICFFVNIFWIIFYYQILLKKLKEFDLSKLNRGKTSLSFYHDTPFGYRDVLHRKEVIQPQVLLRLPCYDFTPIADPTFGRCLAYALAHGLRVLPTLMVWRAVCTRPGNVFTATFWFAITSNSSFM